MAIIRQNSVSGINSVTAENSTLGFYDSAGNTLTIDANVNGNATTATTATNALGITTTQITVGDTFLKINQVGLGQTTTSARDAGISTATGTIIYNETKGSIEIYKGDALGWVQLKEDTPRNNGDWWSYQ